MLLQELLSQAKVDLSVLRHSRTSVMVVAPFNPSREPDKVRVEEFRITGNPQVRQRLFGEFVRRVQPELAEVLHDVRFGLRKLVVPGKPGGERPRYEATFVVDENNYFFRRAASGSEHPFWQDFRDGQGGRGRDAWLTQDRGKHFVLQMREHLRTYCSFLQHNYELLNGFMEYLSTYGSLEGIGALAEDTGFPPLLAERILDHLYLAEPDKVVNLDGINWTFKDANWFSLMSQEETGGTATLRSLLATYHRALLDLPAANARFVSGKNPYLVASELPTVQAYKEKFQQARKALRSVKEMLPCHVLPQEAIAWLLKGLCEAVTGTDAPRFGPQFNDISKAVNEGSQTAAGVINPPINASMSLDQRVELRGLVTQHITSVVKALSDPTFDAAGLPAQVQNVLRRLQKEHSDVVDLVRRMAPAGPDVDDNTSRALRDGAGELLKILFLTLVAPRMFNIPRLDEQPLLDEVRGMEYGCILVANALAAGKVAADLEQVGDDLAAVISNRLKTEGATLSKAALDEVAGNALLKYLPVVAATLGPGLKSKVDLWRAAHRALAYSPGADAASMISGLRALRRFPTGEHATALDNSPVHTDEEMVRRAASAAIERNREIVKLLQNIPEREKQLVQELEKTAEKQKKLNEFVGQITAPPPPADEAVHQAKLATLNKLRMELQDELDDLKSSSEQQSAAAQTMKDRLAQLRQEAAQTPGQVGGGAQGANTNREAGSGDLVALAESIVRQLGYHQDFPPAARPDDAAAPPGPDEQQANQPATQLNEKLLKLQTDADRNAAVELAVEKFRESPANTAALEAVLRSLEQLNHQVYSQYAKAVAGDTEESIPFRRLVETMTLGKIMLFLRKEIGLGGKSSGLQKAVLNLVKTTGRASDDLISPLELFGVYSLHDYLDGGLLRTGQNVVELKKALVECARLSFGNIRDIVSELHGLYYLFHQAADGTTVYVVNAGVREFRWWMDFRNLDKKGVNLDKEGGSGVFHLITSQGRGAGSIRRPGLLYLSKLAFAGLDDPVAELTEWAALRLSRNGYNYLIPPVLLPADLLPGGGEDWQQPAARLDQALRGGARFPWLIVGPSHCLNAPTDKEFPTVVPPGYPPLAWFLGMQEARLLPNREGPEDSLGRIRRISGYGAGVDADLRNAFEKPLPTQQGTVQSFLTDYDLHVTLALYADLKAAKLVPDRNILDHFWKNPKTNTWATINTLVMNRIPLRSCFFSETGCRSCFEENVAGVDAGTNVPVEYTDTTDVVTDVAWFTRALASL